MIARSEAKGGRDWPEDLLGCLDKALKFNFQSKTVVIYLIADAPCHGTQYHDAVVGDDYPNQPAGSLENKMKKLATMENKNVFFTAIKINDGTDKMFNIMQNSFGDRFT